MAVRYYYTPLFDGPTPSDFDTSTDPPTEYPGVPVKQPGKDAGAGVEYVNPPPGLCVLRVDAGVPRCVTCLPDYQAPPLGWTEKTAAEVLADYPGLPGVS